jgi:hypothetical protein
MLAAIAMLAAAAPAAADPLGETAAASAATAGALPAQATQGVAGTVPAVGQATGALSPPVEPVRRDAEPVQRAVKPAQRAADALPQSAERLRSAAGGLPQPAEPVRRAADAVQRAADALPRAAGGEAADSTTRAVGELSRRAPVAPPLDAALQSLGDGLRSLLPVDALAPVAGLLGGAGLADLAPARFAPGRLLHGSGPVALGDGPPQAGARDLLGAHAQPPALAPSRPAAVGGPALTPSRSASARPLAAEAGGRPGSSSPRKAPAPTTGGAAAAAAGGLSFVPFLGLLVLAALAAPMLVRRLAAATASLRPAPFLCALERPG